MSWHLLQKSSSESSVSFQKRSQQNCLSIQVPTGNTAVGEILLPQVKHRHTHHTHSYTHMHTTHTTYTHIHPLHTPPHTQTHTSQWVPCTHSQRTEVSMPNLLHS